VYGYGVVATACLWLDESLLIPTQRGSIQLPSECLILNIKPFFSIEDPGVEFEFMGVMASIDECASEPMAAPA
jgi:hypothetical protein